LEISLLNEKVKYWLELSDYDLETAEAMLKSKRYLYVGFMCHQVVEKILKAHFNSKDPNPAPYTHNLNYLAKQAGIYEMLSEEQKSFMNILNPMNIEARYPSYKIELLKILTEEKCIKILEQTQEFQNWIKQNL
jgi:HEPN domain-containing protein